jgi:hypothetical protein
MTPQEKAKELVDKMGFSTSYTIDNTSGQSTPIYKNQYAKQCAFIAVDEIIENNSKIPGLLTQHTMHNDWFWQEVKTEIEKL